MTKTWRESSVILSDTLPYIVQNVATVAKRIRLLQADMEDVAEFQLNLL